MKLRLLKILHRLGLSAALMGLGLGALWPGQAQAASDVQIVSASLGSLSPCAGTDDTLTVTLEDTSGATFTPYLYVASQFQSVSCGSGFDTSSPGNPELVWEVYNGTDPNTLDTLTTNFPADGGWVAPVTLSYTGQTYTVTFQVQVPGTDDANSSQDINIGASSSYQEASGADSYYCLSYGTCVDVGSMVPSSTLSPTFSVSPTPTLDSTVGTATPTFSVSPTPTLDSTVGTATPTFSVSPTPTLDSTVGTATPTFSISPTPTLDSTVGTATPTFSISPTPTLDSTAGTATPTFSVSPTPILDSTVGTATPTFSQPTTPTLEAGCGLSVYPNFIRPGGIGANIAAQTCVSGIATVNILRQNGRQVLQPISEYLAASQRISFTWAGDLANGSEAPSGIYYVVFTEAKGRAYIQKVLVVR